MNVITETETTEVEWRVDRRRPTLVKSNRNGAGGRPSRTRAIRPSVFIEATKEEPEADSLQLPAKSFEAPYLRKVNREKELARLLGAHGVTVVYTYPACVGKLEQISYYTNDIPDPIILVSWWSNAEKFNQVMARFQSLRQDAEALVSQGIAFWEGKILPEAILAEFNREQVKYIREWVKDIIETCDVIPTPERYRLPEGYSFSIFNT